MNRQIIRLAACAALACVTFGLTSCKDDEKDPREFVKTSVKYRLQLNDALFKVADFYVYYLNEKGEQVKDTVRTTKWEKTFTTGKFPVRYGIYVKASLKTTYPYVADQYVDLKYQRNMDVTIYRRNGESYHVADHLWNNIKTSKKKAEIVEFINQEGPKFDYNSRILNKSGEEQWLDYPWVLN